MQPVHGIYNSRVNWLQGEWQLAAWQIDEEKTMIRTAAACEQEQNYGSHQRIEGKNMSSALVRMMRPICMSARQDIEQQAGAERTRNICM